ncbi:unnamed protein product [Acanthoscelides obtectus]|uniref:Uncharacterized protein n=1 Tax=Acanthoscelides obtectus TaxID=200917 RepID=A0A9P0L0X4_ACAOB|nr:unnamed protein product [Acanthoscelides obtectus]CAK1668735.1 hypothetical protein AOBTE_LOCUS26571 [Acanthoscelides obtectus]
MSPREKIKTRWRDLVPACPWSIVPRLAQRYYQK